MQTEVVLFQDKKRKKLKEEARTGNEAGPAEEDEDPDEFQRNILI